MTQASRATGPARPASTLPALAARAVEVALAVALAWIAAQALWLVIYGTDGLAIEVEAPAPSVGPQTAANGAAGSASGLFAALPGAAPAAQPDAPETRLNLTLRGVRSGADGTGGSAVIETPNRGQRSLGVGEEIAPGVTLYAVYDERVIINRNGARESLYLTEAAARRAREARNAAPARNAQADDPAPVALTGQPDAAAALDRDAWREGLRLEPALDDGAMVGMRVRDSSAREVLRASGLLPGDIIVRLNGEALTSAQAAGRAVRSLETADQVVLSVRRGGQDMTLEARLP